MSSTELPICHESNVRAGEALDNLCETPLYLAIAGHEAVGEPIGGWEPAAPQGQ